MAVTITDMAKKRSASDSGGLEQKRPATGMIRVDTKIVDMVNLIALIDKVSVAEIVSPLLLPLLEDRYQRCIDKLAASRGDAGSRRK